MSLKYRYTNQQEVPAALTSHYVEKDGSFVLNVEGAVEKSRLEELSQNNALLARERMNCASDSTASIPMKSANLPMKNAGSKKRSTSRPAKSRKSSKPGSNRFAATSKRNLQSLV